MKHSCSVRRHYWKEHLKTVLREQGYSFTKLRKFTEVCMVGGTNLPPPPPHPLPYKLLRNFANLSSYNGGQKCWDLSSDIIKTSDPSPPTPNKVELGAKWVKISALFGHHIARGSGWGVGGRRDEPKAEQ